MIPYEKLLHRAMRPAECPLYPPTACEAMVLRGPDLNRFGRNIEIIKINGGFVPPPDDDNRTFYTADDLTDENVKRLLAKVNGVEPDDIELK